MQVISMGVRKFIFYSVQGSDINPILSNEELLIFRLPTKFTETLHVYEEHRNLRERSNEEGKM